MTTAMIAALLLSTPAFAEITIADAYARVASPAAKAGAIFLELHNSGDIDDRLVSATSTAAKRVELHTHIDQGGGVMKMTEIEGGIPVPANGMHLLQRGGDHVMFMGLTESWTDGDRIAVTLTFEQAGDISIEVPVDLTRQPDMGMTHGGMKNEAMN
jgi:hypothetical protein